MAITKKQEARALSLTSRNLSVNRHHPELQKVSDEELRNLVKLVRDPAEIVRGQKQNRRRREMRGKATPKGAAASRAETGPKLMLAVLAMAMRRLKQ